MALKLQELRVSGAGALLESAGNVFRNMLRAGTDEERQFAEWIAEGSRARAAGGTNAPPP